MVVVNFLGRITPQGPKINLQNLPQLELEPIEGESKHRRFHLEIKDSVVKVIRHLISESNSDGDIPLSKQWEKMRELLRIDEQYLKAISGFSKDHRHGKRNTLRAKDIDEMMSRSWAVMNRFSGISEARSATVAGRRISLIKI